MYDDGIAAIQIPYNDWRPRPDQMPLWSYLEHGGKRALVIAHRRWGKDEVGLHWAAVSAMTRVGTYWHMLPQYSQARKAIWEAVNPHTGVRRIDEAFPEPIRETTREQEMFIKFKNGSTWQVVGSDNYNSLVGSPPVGLVVSEWALADPAAWAYLRPILAENNGWALFITTPRGRNHAYKMLESARKDPTWHAQVIPATDSGVFKASRLASELDELIGLYGPDHGKALWDQEYMCSFAAASLGSYYGLAMEMAERDGRITNLAYDPALPVVTAWDLGIGDSTAIWFLQVGAGQVRAIDYYETNGQPLNHYVKVLKDKPYIYAQHIGPHDLGVRELGSGQSRAEIAADLGVEFTIAPKLPVDDGINAVRLLLPKMWFDREKCARAIEALTHYHKDWDAKVSDWRNAPVHDWSSHCADALRMFAVASPILEVEQYKKPDKYQTPKAPTIIRRRYSQSGGKRGSWMAY